MEEGERGRGEESQEGVFPVALHTDAASNRSGSFKGIEAAAVREDPSSNHEIRVSPLPPGLQTETFNIPSSVTRGDLVSLEHSSPPHDLLNASAIHAHGLIPEIHQHAHVPEVKTSTFCSSFPPPASTGDFATRATAAFPLVEEQSRLPQGPAGEVSITGETLFQGQGGRGRGRGGRGRGRSGHNQSDNLSLSESKGDTSNKRGSSKRGKGGAGRGKNRAASLEEALPNQENRVFVLPTTSALTVTEGLNNTGGALPSLEGGRSQDGFKSMEISEEIHEHAHARQHGDTRVCETSPFCTSLPPAASCTVTGVSGAIQPVLLHVEEQRRPGDHAEIELGQKSIRADEGPPGKLASMEESSSRGRGRRGRGRGRGEGGRGRGRRGQREDHTAGMSPSISASAGHTDKTPNRKRAKGAPGQGKQRKEGTPHQEIRASVLPIASMGTGGEVSFSEVSAPHDHLKRDVLTPGFRVLETYAVGNSVPPAPCPGDFVAGVSSVPLAGFPQVEEHSRVGDHVEAPPSRPSSPKGGKLRQELADFLMTTRSNLDKPGDQAGKSARKKTKSRKVVENENLWRELTEGSSPSKAAGSAVDPTAKDVGKTSREIHTPSTVCVEEPDGVSKEGECFISTEGEGFCEVSEIECGANVNAKVSGKKRMRQVLKDHGRFSRPPFQNQGDVTGRVRQAPDIVAQPGSHWGLPSATEEASACMGNFPSACGSIEFVEDWHSYCPYPPSSPNLIPAYEDGRPSISSLPLFGSSRVTACTDKTWPDYYDLVLNAGGSIWALDWCPKRGYMEGYRREFLAVGAHPYDTPTHRLGEVVQGKGLIQIWAFDLPFLSQAQANWHFHNPSTHGRGKQKVRGAIQARGKRKKDTADDEDVRELFVPDAIEMLGVGSIENPHPLFLEEGRHNVGAGIDLKCVKVESFVPALASSPNIEESDLPQMVLGLAHDAGLVWDAKWQPTSGLTDSSDMCRLGFLAAVFGDGSMQVYDIPLPSLVRKLPACSSTHSSLTPMVVKMKPVFKCSGLSAGGQSSLPLTIEWSSSPPHDHLFVGCHDGAVALWRFKPEVSCDEDTRPLTCFVADTSPIRALAFAPEGSDAESRNIVVTGGHSGRLLFWDLRDPFYPLWDLALSKGGCIFSIDWPLYPRGIVLSMDDGTIRTLSLDVALCDSPLTGTPPTKTLSQGMHTTFTSDYAIWSVHVSRASGLAVYGGEDGSIIQFQLTDKYFVNDRARAKEPHFMCCKLIEDPSSGVLSLASLGSDAPLHVKNQRGDNKQVPLTKAFSRRASGGMNEEEDESKKKRRRPASKSTKRSLLKGEVTDDDELSSDEVNNLALVPFDPNNCAKPKSTSRSLSTKVGSEGSKRRSMKKHGEPSAASGREADALLDVGEAHPANALPERPPSKAVAVHRVRWNQNKDCESLVCFGGAAGIIRCQLIMPRA